MPPELPQDHLDLWLEELVATPGLTSLTDPGDARRFLLEDALRARDLVETAPGPIVDVGSGGGSPGIPLAVALPHRRFALLEAERRKCDFLRRMAAPLENVDVIWGRAENQTSEAYGVALAKALAKAPVAAELCLPLVAEGGVAILWVGATVETSRVAAAALALNARLESSRDGLVVLRKVGPTPPGFPRKPGIAKKRPLA